MRTVSCLVVAAFAVTAAGCTTTVEPIDSGPPVVVSSATGALNVDWTINGTTDPNQCVQGGAAAIQIAVTNSLGQDVGTFQQSCTVFSTSITLTAGNYSAAAQLIDATGLPRTTSVFINPFTLYGNDTFSAPIDFSASSFY